MKKIILFSSSDIFIDRFFNEYLKLLSLDYDLTIVSNFNKEYFKNKKFKIIDIPFARKPKLYKDLLILFRIFFILKKNNPDLIITCTPKIQFYFLFLNFFFSYKRVHIYTGIYWQNFSILKKKFYQIIDILNFKFSYKVFFDSKYQISIFKDLKVNNKNLELISNGSIKGVDLIKFKQNKIFYDRYRYINSIDRSEIIILFVGRLCQEKGLDLLLNAFCKLIDENYKILLKIVGNDEYNFKSQVDKMPLRYQHYIKVYYEKSKPYNFYKISDILCLPSRREGFGLSAVEGSACGIPVVCSDIGGFSESVIDNITGLKFKDGDYLDLCKTLKKLLDDNKLITMLGNNGKNFAKKFDSNIVIKNFYKQLTNCFN